MSVFNKENPLNIPNSYDLENQTPNRLPKDVISKFVNTSGSEIPRSAQGRFASRVASCTQKLFCAPNKGFVNNGNTCFVNSTFQCFFTNESFVLYFKLLLDNNIFSKYDEDLLKHENSINIEENHSSDMLEDSTGNDEQEFETISRKRFKKNGRDIGNKKEDASTTTSSNEKKASVDKETRDTRRPLEKKSNIMWVFLQVVRNYLENESLKKKNKQIKKNVRIIESDDDDDDDNDNDDDDNDKKDDTSDDMDDLTYSGFITRRIKGFAPKIEKKVPDNSSIGTGSNNPRREASEFENGSTPANKGDIPNSISNAENSEITKLPISDSIDSINSSTGSGQSQNYMLENAKSFGKRIKGLFDLSYDEDDDKDNDVEDKLWPKLNSKAHKEEDSDESIGNSFISGFFHGNGKNQSPNSHISILYFIDFMRKENPYLFNGRQQDAHEFIMYIVNELDECILKKRKSLNDRLQHLEEAEYGDFIEKTLNLSEPLNRGINNDNNNTTTVLNDPMTIARRKQEKQIQKIQTKLEILNYNGTLESILTRDYFDQNNRNACIDKEEIEIQNRHWNDSICSKNCSPIKQLFSGQLKSTIECSVCKNQSINFESFIDLSLEIPDNPKNHQLCNIALCYIDFSANDITQYRKILFETSKYTSIFKTLKKYRTNIFSEDISHSNLHFNNSADHLLFSKTPEGELEYLDCETAQCKDVPPTAALMLYKKICVNGESQDGESYTEFEEIIIRFNMFFSDDFDDEEKDCLKMPIFISFREDMSPTDFYSIVEAIFQDYFEEYQMRCKQKNRNMPETSLDDFFRLFCTVTQQPLDISEKDRPFQAFVTRQTQYGGKNVYSIDVHWKVDDFDKTALFRHFIEQRFILDENMIGKRIQNKRIMKMKIDDIFDNFGQPEIMDGDNKWFCNTCGEKQRAEKRLSVVQFPQYLILHLKRFRISSEAEEIQREIIKLGSGNMNGVVGMRKYQKVQELQQKMTEKVKAVVLYYENDLDTTLLTNLEKDDMQLQPNNRFSFASSIIHSGYSPHNGHYTATCKRDGDIYLFNDSQVSKQEKFIPTYEAYILFYNKDK